MRRREFIALLGSAAAAAWPLAVHAQQPADKIPRIGFLGIRPTQPQEVPATITEPWRRTQSTSFAEPFREGLRQLGWSEGQNITIEYRWTEGQPDRAVALAKELVELGVDIIVAPTSPLTEAARQATNTIPIVFCVHGDPIGAGDVASLEHFPNGLNQVGFPRRRGSDSWGLLAKEASPHGPSPVL